MDIAKLKKSILKLTDTYIGKLAIYPDENFLSTPPIDGWSYSEVYSHIFDSSLLSLIAIQNCTAEKGQIKPTVFAAKLVLFFGSFPPAARYKVPKKLMERVKKISKEEALEMINSFIPGLEAACSTINPANKAYKIQHPRLGYLNAEEWLRFIEIHLKHHLKQLGRIEKSYKHMH